MNNLCPICYQPCDEGVLHCPECGAQTIDVPVIPRRMEYIFCPWCQARCSAKDLYTESKLYNCSHCSKSFKILKGNTFRVDSLSTAAKILIFILFMVFVFPFIIRVFL